jgi:hypothetical protein
MTTSVVIRLNSTLFDNDDVKKMKYDLRQSGKFNSVRLVIDLSDRVTGMDGDGTETEEIGGTVTRTTETTTKLND